jgi:hypothetical protein
LLSDHGNRPLAFYNALGFEEVGRIPIRDEAVNVFMNQPGDGDMPRLVLTCNFCSRLCFVRDPDRSVPLCN